MKTNLRLTALEYDMRKVKEDLSNIYNILEDLKKQANSKPQRLTRIERKLKSREFVEKIILDLIEKRNCMTFTVIFDEVQEHTQVSRSNFTNALRSLKDKRIIEVDKLTGYYYFVKPPSSPRQV